MDPAIPMAPDIRAAAGSSWGQRRVVHWTRPHGFEDTDLARDHGISAQLPGTSQDALTQGVFVHGLACRDDVREPHRESEEFRGGYVAGPMAPAPPTGIPGTIPCAVRAVLSVALALS